MKKSEKEVSDVRKRIIQRHLSRRMFVIISNKLVISPKDNPQSHDEWFVEKKWIKNKRDLLLETIVRGNVTSKGDIHFYSGRLHFVNSDVEKIFFKFLPELVKKLKISPNAKIGGGMIIGIPGEQWLPKKEYGKVSDFIKTK